ncbi:hypothetical protein T12_4436 [Trichinella patagoniensis]|uniref:Uncharacterized protein n=1 Tax=Trichinella patagoniensis TaxID=990121 RepID=A0A0V0Z3U0_9BILA|nr:hypothetical protein T12_4436 [Trichinella patagoniensis]
MSLVYEGRAYKLKRAGRQKYWRCSQDKKGCGGSIWTNLDVTSVIKQNDHIESCPADEHLAYKMEKKTLLKKRSAEETKPIPVIYDEEASAASAEPSTPDRFPFFKGVKSTMYSHRAKRYPKLPCRWDLQIPVPFSTTKAGECFFIVAECIEAYTGCTTMVSTTVYHPCLCGGPYTRDLGLLPEYAGTGQEWMTDERLPLWNVHNILIAEQGVMDTLIQQVLSGNATVGDLKRVNKVYAEKQQQVAQYTGEYTNVSPTMEQFLEALMYITPEPI